MTLIRIKSSGSSVNLFLMRYAVEHAPSLIIDCANCANPHSLYPEFTMQELAKVYVMEAEMLYKFRDTLRRIAYTRPPVKTIVITSVRHLFNYDDEIENKNLLEHCSVLIKYLSRKYRVIMAWDTQYGAKELYQTLCCES
jgi:hypothetical protein